MTSLLLAVIASTAAIHAGVCFQVEYSVTHTGEFEHTGPPLRHVTLRSLGELSMPARQTSEANVEVVRLMEKQQQVTLRSPAEVSMPARQTSEASIDVVRRIEKQETRRPSLAVAVLAGTFALAAVAKLVASMFSRLPASRCCHARKRRRHMDENLAPREDARLRRVRGKASPHSKEPDAEHEDNSSDDEASETYDFVAHRSSSEDESEMLQSTSLRCAKVEGTGIKIFGGSDKLSLAYPELRLADVNTDEPGSEPEPDYEPGADSCDEASGIELSPCKANAHAFDMTRILDAAEENLTWAKTITHGENAKVPV